MQIHLHIGPDAMIADRMQYVLDAARGRLTAQGIRFAQSLGARSHTRLFMAASDPSNLDSLRFYRGFADAEAQEALREQTLTKLQGEIDKHEPDHLILSAAQLGTQLRQRDELLRLRDLLAPLCDTLSIHATVDDPARLLARRYATQVLDGRVRTLDLEIGLLAKQDFREAALSTFPMAQPRRSLFSEAQGAAFWLDFRGMQAAWEEVFGAGSVRFHTVPLRRLFGKHGARAALDILGLSAEPGPVDPADMPDLPSAVWLSRARRMNDALLRYAAAKKAPLPKPLWRKLLVDIKKPGPLIAPGSLHKISARFARDLDHIAQNHAAVDRAQLQPDAPLYDWKEADPQEGFRASQYLMAFRWRIDNAMKDARDEAAFRPSSKADNGPPAVDSLLSPPARLLLPKAAKSVFLRLRKSDYAPHDSLGQADTPTHAFVPAISTPGRIIVGCMKNEAPYLLEWIAYHRAIGFDDFLIYTNDCGDGTDAMLDRLQAMGIAQHRDNSAWSGRSPQQHALDAALDEPVVRQAAWIAHIDVDEFINIRCGNGTLDDLFALTGDATNIAMTWRLFGHNGVTTLKDAPVIAQFDHGAPRYCPKPHTAWGFKSLSRNIGAYGKLSCHRPNRLRDAAAAQVRWVNGSGQDMTHEVLKNGWRNSRRSIGYDLVQLNHYALRSADSFLVKRQRGRALHVDRGIGLNYWIRMDWSYHRDTSIQRNLPRMLAERDRLLADPDLRALHDAGFAWHRAKAAELHATPEFADLHRQTMQIQLTEMERVAYALALDMES